MASREYQSAKINELNDKKLSDIKEYQKQYDKITEKTCLCTGLVSTVYTLHDILKKSDGNGVSICPGPNMAYFTKKATLHEMVDHIYEKTNLLNDTYRPNMFLKELGMYVNYLFEEIDNTPLEDINDRKVKYFNTFKDNLILGIAYYKNILPKLGDNTNWENELDNYLAKLNQVEIPSLEYAN